MLKNKVKIYFHVATIGDYQNIVDSMFKSIIDSGLIAHADELILSVVGSGLVTHPKFDNIIIERNASIDIGEFYTLNKIKEFSDKTNENYKILYIHTKGVTTPNNECIVDWRKYMIFFNITEYRKCLTELITHDTCGVDLVDIPTRHYSGNFWWVNSYFVKSLPSINEISNPNAKKILTIRHNAEFWVGMVVGDNKSMHDSNINVYERHLHRYPESEYKNN